MSNAMDLIYVRISALKERRSPQKINYISRFHSLSRKNIQVVKIFTSFHMKCTIYFVICFNCSHICVVEQIVFLFMLSKTLATTHGNIFWRLMFLHCYIRLCKYWIVCALHAIAFGENFENESSWSAKWHKCLQKMELEFKYRRSRPDICCVAIFCAAQHLSYDIRITA